MSWRLFRMFGIPLRVDASWLVVLALLTATLAHLFNAVLPGRDSELYWALGLVTALAFFACIVLHEFGHALVARKKGMAISGVTLFLFGGIAELEEEPGSAGTEFWMAIAGPVVSAVLALAFAGLAIAGELAGWAEPALAVLGFLFWINLTVLLFNLVPAFPLDGGRVLRSILWGLSGNLRRATWWASLAGQGFAMVLITLGVVQFMAGNLVGGMWTGLIGLFLNSAARRSYEQVVVRQILAGEPVRRFMNPTPIVVPPGLDLRHWVDDFVYRFHHKAFPVTSNGHVEGLVKTATLSNVPRSEWGTHTVSEVMDRNLGPISIHPDADALQALTKMQRTGASRLLVLDNDHLEGMLSLKDLLAYLDVKLSLQDNK